MIIPWKILTLVMASACSMFAAESAVNKDEVGPFLQTWESLANYQCPEWFRDAKFGIWAHWGPQCVLTPGCVLAP